MSVPVTCKEFSRKIFCMRYGPPKTKTAQKQTTAQITSPPSIIGGCQQKNAYKGDLQEQNSM